MYVNSIDVKRITGLTDPNFIIQNLIQENCRKLNSEIGCYEWTDNTINNNLKTLILYSAEKIYKFQIKKRFVFNKAKFEKKIIKFIRKTMAN